MRRLIEHMNNYPINIIPAMAIGLKLPAKNQISLGDFNPQFAFYFNVWNRVIYNNKFKNIELPFSQMRSGFEFSKPIYM